jgi:aryl-alcohol dehydrogenase-like predicted oxidoreductase
MNHLALGTVQFGMSYGVANQQGQVGIEMAEKILNYAWTKGIDTLDTAIAYGNSEQTLGEIGVEAWRIVTKLPSLPTDITNISEWLETSLQASLERLKVKTVYGLLLHKPQDLLGNQGQELYKAVCHVKARGWVEKIGISIYHPQELERLVNSFHIDIVQTPFSVLDQRLITSGWLDTLDQRGIEIHIRSIFLQGLLLMEPSQRPQYFSRWNKLWQKWQKWLLENDLTSLQACLRFALQQPKFDRVIVGVESLTQLQEILAATSGSIPKLPDEFQCDDLDLICPTHWHLP